MAGSPVKLNGPVKRVNAFMRSPDSRTGCGRRVFESIGGFWTDRRCQHVDPREQLPVGIDNQSAQPLRSHVERAWQQGPQIEAVERVLAVFISARIEPWSMKCAGLDVQQGQQRPRGLHRNRQLHRNDRVASILQVRSPRCPSRDARLIGRHHRPRARPLRWFLLPASPRSSCW